MKKISSNELKQIQLSILKNVHLFCEKNNIKYTLAYGTLLGAVRHKGFIPWDNDIDIAMLRCDYDRFIKTYRDENYKLYALSSDSECDIPYAKVYDPRTVLGEHSALKTIGINIDIFPIDNLYDSYNLSIKKYKEFNFLKIKKMFKGRLPAPTTAWWKIIILYIGKIFLAGVKVRNISERISRKAQINKNNNSKYVGLLVGNSVSLNNVMERKIYNDRILIKFEDSMFWGLRKYDEYLTITYGDYMKLPPKKQRIAPHFSEEVYWK